MKRYLIDDFVLSDEAIEEYVNKCAQDSYELMDLKPYCDEEHMDMRCLIVMCREEEHPQRELNLDKRDVIEESNAMLQTEKPRPWEHLEWDNCAIEFAQNYAKEGYDVTVKDNSGDVIRTWVALYEWSGYVTPFINEKDVPGLVSYLVELNRIDRREGTYIRSEEWL